MTGAYGGYFGAGQAILYVAMLGIARPITLQRANAMKNAIAGLVNLTAGIFFVLRGAPVDWAVVGLIAVGATAGGQLGARFGRRLSAPILRGVIVAVGVVAFCSVV